MSGCLTKTVLDLGRLGGHWAGLRVAWEPHIHKSQWTKEGAGHGHDLEHPLGEDVLDLLHGEWTHSQDMHLSPWKKAEKGKK